jgi:hypothetical protein
MPSSYQAQKFSFNCTIEELKYVPAEVVVEKETAFNCTIEELKCTLNQHNFLSCTPFNCTIEELKQIIINE